MSQLLPERRSRLAPDRWEPLSDLEQMTERMRRMLEQTLGGPGFSSTDTSGWLPFVDVEEADDAYVVEVDLPGVRRDDVDIELVGNELSISGEVKEQERKGVLRHQTRRRGRFAYRIVLADQVDAEKVEAKLAEGVLKVRVPKSERAQRRKIEVKA
jgi:HSP20 family protein